MEKLIGKAHSNILRKKGNPEYSPNVHEIQDEINNLKSDKMKKYKTTIPELTLKKKETDIKKVKIQSSRDASDYARNFYFDDLGIFESFFILLLNRANNTIGYVKISQGGTAGTVVDPKLIAKYAIEGLAESVIMIHNHPSGNTKPSNSDIKITNKVKNGLAFFDIKVLDHVIITEESYYSFLDEGLI